MQSTPLDEVQEDLEDRIVLVTNLDSVKIGNLMLYCHALLLMDTVAISSFGTNADVKRDLRIRGFKMDAADDVFQTFVQGSMDYKLVDVATGYSAQNLVVGDVTIGLGRSNDREPFDIQLFRAPGEVRVILDVWPVLESKIIRYWTAPNIPHRTYMPHIR